MSDLRNEESLESLAYREAGHVLLAYLIQKAGIADHFFALPIQASDRWSLVPGIEVVSLDGELSKLERTPSSLRSLITTPIFLLGGLAAERIRDGTPIDAPLANSVAIGRAMGMLASYFEEFGVENSQERESTLPAVIRDFYEFTEHQVSTHWASLQALARRLLDQKSLSKDEAFELIEVFLPEETREAVRRIASGESQDRHA